MITGHQVRTACRLLQWTRHDLNRHTGLPLWMVDRILTGMADPDPSPDGSLQDAFDRAGIDFIIADDGTSSATLRTAPQAERAS